MKWEQWQIDYLKENWDKYLDKDLMKYLGVKPDCFYAKKRELGCLRFKWTEEKIELLKKYYPIASWEELFQILGCNKKSSITSMAHLNGISRDVYNNNKLSNSDKEFVRNNYMNMSVHEMSDIIGKRAEYISNYARNNHIKVYFGHEIRPWDEELFIELYPKYTNKYLHEKYFPYLSRAQLGVQARKYGLIKTPEKSVKWFDKEQLLEDLESAVRKLGRAPLLVEFKSLGLPAESTYRRYFGSVTKVFELIGIERPCYVHGQQHKLMVYRDKNNNFCLSMSEVIISNILIDLGVTFEKEVPYKSFINDDDIGEKISDWKIDNKIIEYFGMVDYKDYNNGMNLKIEVCKRHNIPLLALYPDDQKNIDKMKQKIKEFINI